MTAKARYRRRRRARFAQPAQARVTPVSRFDSHAATWLCHLMGVLSRYDNHVAAWLCHLRGVP